MVILKTYSEAESLLLSQRTHVTPYPMDTFLGCFYIFLKSTCANMNCVAKSLIFSQSAHLTPYFMDAFWGCF